MAEKILCNLCPRRCNVDRTLSLGFCGQGNIIKIARAALHYWEEPCISGTNGSGTVFFSGCSLKCAYCQNYKLSHLNFGKEIQVDRLADIFLELQELGACNINLVSPTHFVLEIIEALKICNDKLKIPVVYNTGGYENIATLKMLEGYVDIYLTDIKYFDNKLGRLYSKADDYFDISVSAASEMIRQKRIVFDGDILKQGVVIRHLVLPGQRKDSIKILEQLKARFGTDSFILSLMSQYTPNEYLSEFPEIDRKITTFEYNSVLNTAVKLGFKYGYMQNRTSAEQKYTPPFDLSGVIKER